MDHGIPDSVVSELIELISNETGLRFDGHQLDTVRNGIRAAMQRSGERNPHRVLQQISSNSPIFDDLVSELTIGETYFFREPAQFAVIRHELLPSLRRQKGENHRVRVWSAGCATGEEPYSIAMLLHELRMLERSHVLATDISHHALAKARAARYRSWSLRGSENPLLKEFLIDDTDGHLVDQRIRPHVVFEYLNLALDSYPSFANGTWGLDLILCRNVLIYFSNHTIAAVAKRFFECLSPGGWLMLGASDPRISDFAPFETRMTDSGVVYRRPERADTPGRAASRIAVNASDQFSADLSTTQSVDAASRSAWYAKSREQTSDSRYPAKSTQATNLSTQPTHPPMGGGADGSGLDASSSPEVCAESIREIAKVDTERAAQQCAAAVARYPISVELRFLHAVILMELERYADAVEAARRVVFLDRELAIAHMTLGTALQRTGQDTAARRAFRNALRLCSSRPAAEIVKLSDGEQAGRLAMSAQQHLALLDEL